jgi:BirA family biotin operon repressor/biotin-[acetyl-CoA-carboxylase] ligase
VRRADSTNDRARALAIAGAPHGTLVTAAEQTAGHGRQGRTWSAPAGSSVLMSLILRGPPRLLPMIAAVAVCDVAGENAQIKWPNDVVVAQPAGDASEAPVLAKLAGILIEGRPQEGWAVLGIGLNVAVDLGQLPGRLRAGGATAGAGLPAATLGMSTADVEPTLAGLLGALERRLGETPAQTLAAWRAKDALRGREIAWQARGSSGRAGRGSAQGIDGDGRLIVALDGGGQTALSSGEVHLAAAQ